MTLLMLLPFCDASLKVSSATGLVARLSRFWARARRLCRRVIQVAQAVCCSLHTEGQCYRVCLRADREFRRPAGQHSATSCCSRGASLLLCNLLKQSSTYCSVSSTRDETQRSCACCSARLSQATRHLPPCQLKT